MAIETVFALALYCQCCGKTTTYELSRFALKNGKKQTLVCSCGQIHAEVKSAIRGQWLLSIPCPLCQTEHVFCIDGKNTIIRRLYCDRDNLELGFLGSPGEVASVVARHKYDLQQLADDTKIKNPHLIVEILNRLHDIAENGGLYCGCGSMDIEAKLLDDGIELFCLNCGGHHCFYAQVEELRYLKSINHLELLGKRYFQRK